MAQKMSQFGIPTIGQKLLRRRRRRATLLARSRTRSTETRVAVFTDTFDEVNGVAQTYHRLWEYAVRTGKRLDIYCFSDREEGEERQGRACIHRLRRVAPLSYYENLSLEMAPNLPLLQALYASRPHVIHVASPDVLGFHGSLLARVRRVPLVGFYHTCLPEYAAHYVRSPRLARFVTRVSWAGVKAFYNRCGLVLATTPALGARLKASGLRPPVRVCPGGVDVEAFHPRNRRADASPGRPPVILYVGRISVEKNLKWYADVLQRLRAQGVEFTARFVGDGPYRQELQGLLPWAEFTGYLRGDDLTRAFASADVFAFPSRTDTFGNVVVEAMASGLPCVVADPCGPGETVRPGVNGFVAPGAEAFAERLAQLAGQEELRRAMGLRSREMAEGYAWDAIFDELWARYEDLHHRRHKLRRRRRWNLRRLRRPLGNVAPLR